MPSRVGIKRRLWWLALAAPLLAGLDRLPTTPLGLAPRLLDEQLQRAFFQLRGSRPTPADPLILAIDADSLELGELLDPSERQASPLWRRMGAWPWPRALQARLAALVLERGAARVLFNIEYGEPSRFGPADDRAFAATLAPWRDQVHLAVRFGVREGGDWSRAGCGCRSTGSAPPVSPPSCSRPGARWRHCPASTGSRPSWPSFRRPCPVRWPSWRGRLHHRRHRWG